MKYRSKYSSGNVEVFLTRHSELTLAWALCPVSDELHIVARVEVR